MAIPHIIFKQLARKRLEGKDNNEKIKEIKKLITELPGYRTGPYGEIRKWLKSELEGVKKKKSSTHRDWFAVRKEGNVQVAVVGAPNAGKSSLLKALTNVQAKVAPYAFTTLKPIPAVCVINGAAIQLVEVPGLIENAHTGKGMGKRLLSVAKGADFIAVVFGIDNDPVELEKTLAELRAVGIADIQLIIANKMDIPGAQENLKVLRDRLRAYIIIPVSAERKEGLEALKLAVWDMLGLIRVFSKEKSGDVSQRAVLLPEKSTVRDFAEKLHWNIGNNLHSASVWGSSAKFSGQQVGMDHVLQDEDVVQLHE